MRGAAYSLVTIVLILIAGAVGYYIAKNNLTSTVGVPGNTQNAPAPKAQTIFQSQNATIQGTITKVEGQNISVTNVNGESGQFPVSSKVVIYKFRPGSSQASPSSELKDISINKPVLINLELTGGQYQVTSISDLATPN